MILNTLSLIIIVTLVLLYFIRPKKYNKEKEGEWVGENKQGETRVLRGYTGIDKLVDSTPQGNETIADLVNGFNKKDKKQFIGYRELKNKVVAKTIIEKCNGKEIRKEIYQYEMSPYVWYSSKEFYHLICRISNGLRVKGFKKGDKIGMFCETRFEWMAMALACARQGITLVTVYATLGEESVRVALEETKCVGLIVSEETGIKMRKIELNKEIKIISIDGHFEGEYTTFKELSESKEDEETIPSVAPNDLAFIMYTSGTTKEPKGVLVEQKQILLLAQAFNICLDLKDEVFVAYLPLAHIFELCLEFCILSFFGSIGYANARTLMSVGCTNCKSDLCELEPTLVIGVPTVFNRIRKAILESVSRAPTLKQSLFFGCMKLKNLLYVSYQLRTPLLFEPIVKFVDSLIFNPLKVSLFGRNLKTIIIGGSALPVELQTFLTITCAKTNILQGFGMTELCGASSCMVPGDSTQATIGLLFPHYELKLRDVPELNYLTTDNPPRGELMLRGAPVSKGYFNRPEESKSTFTEDGWVCTGDIAKITEDHHICIIDRKKNIVKQPCGEYISLELIESKYLTSKVVDTICVFADAFHDFTIALVLPNKNIIAEMTQKPFEEACKDKEIIGAVRKIMAENEIGLSQREVVKRIALISEEWNSENGMLTAALKLKRPAIAQRYQTIIDQLYSMN
ncbi:long-chain-fatty-acid--CoA ligase, putative [Entamoeba dispar SAW760]|uniref:Long-chain-fatty-acid--CoA ligase, putative n=1 Tax=Entamoeba dispar (strain ATCC PRA-260 / SAW760) TaxID=370354 RepID=B0E8D0_ENTDS|nr:long-chain-fatty-acid--CoA ligase, putative [Entamoeba dispar SAW760]EDR29255.1 long-chain-fatty-acid--CoA ligase, putative [Entamoeba dispar SAW760]|eukprot:EDR29255.1 long-chain-fatty-acid--CoA ligase, putative [Entamoeba dispar SAW760]